MAEGFFRSKKGFTVIQNEITRDTGISLKAKGLYLIIQAYITMPDKKWAKEDFRNLTKEGRKAFDSAWKELKDNGYLKVHFMPDNGKWRVEYELLDEPDHGPHTLYHNSDGQISSDNIQRAEKKRKEQEQEGQMADEDMDDRYPLFGSNADADDRYPPFGSNANGNNANSSNADGSNANGGNNYKDLNIIPGHKTFMTNPDLIWGEAAEQYPMKYLEKLYSAGDMIQMGASERDIEMVMEILYDALNTTKKTIWIKREEKPASVVKSRLLKLECQDIVYAVEQFHKQTTEIRHQKAYMLSVLYDAKGQGHLDFSNQVQHDFYGNGREGG